MVDITGVGAVAADTILVDTTAAAMEAHIILAATTAGLGMVVGIVWGITQEMVDGATKDGMVDGEAGGDTIGSGHLSGLAAFTSSILSILSGVILSKVHLALPLAIHGFIHVMVSGTTVVGIAGITHGTDVGITQVFGTGTLHHMDIPHTMIERRS